MLTFSGQIHAAAQFMSERQLKDRALWKKFVEIYREKKDGQNNGWRGEYWGKMMRGGALVFEYTRDKKLYDILRETVCDMLSVAEIDGRVSTYTRDTEFNGWDLWCRKYVMLGCEYFMDICDEAELREQILSFLGRQADYILAHIGEGKTPITQASGAWYGVNSASILEPMVKLYRLTGQSRYLDFATHIVQSGGAEGIDMFEMAYEDKILPYQYGVSKAYEMISCFEGLLEYYHATGTQKYKQAAINFGKRVLESEVSVIGSCGVTHELFDHTALRQTAEYDGVKQETCVTVTWMKFLAKLLDETGDIAFADAMERAFYNAYLGALNTEGKVCPYINARYMPRLNLPPAKDTFLPVDSYSPLTPDTRGKKTGGVQLLADNTYYGCCACISAAGVGIFAKTAMVFDGNTLCVNFFERGKAEFDELRVRIDTDYPIGDTAMLEIETERDITLRVRRPEQDYEIHSLTKGTHHLTLSFDMSIRTMTPSEWDEDVVYTQNARIGRYDAAEPVRVHFEEKDKHFIAFRRGPLVLAADDRLGKAADSIFEAPSQWSKSDKNEICDGAPCLIRMDCTTATGDRYSLADYASVGRDWSSTVAAWLKTK